MVDFVPCTVESKDWQCFAKPLKTFLQVIKRTCFQHCDCFADYVLLEYVKVQINCESFLKESQFYMSFVLISQVIQSINDRFQRTLFILTSTIAEENRFLFQVNLYQCQNLDMPLNPYCCSGVIEVSIYHTACFKKGLF